MPRQAFLTPDSLEGTEYCFPLTIPGTLFRYVAGALAELASVYNWEQLGTVTPEGAAEYFNEWLFQLSEENCMALPKVGRVLTLTSNLVIATNTLTTISAWEGFGYGGASEIGQPSRFVAPVDGEYSMTVQLNWLAAASSIRGLRVYKNGSTSSFALYTEGTFSVTNTQTITGKIPLLANDYLQVAVFQTSGGNTSIRGNASIPYSHAHFWLDREGE